MSTQPSASSAPRTCLIGVDTGGTYTDAAIIESQGHRVLASAKAITTKGDLAIGVTEAITNAIAALPQGLAPQDIALVSVSTTLATNAVVEGHGSAVGVLLIGFDEAMAERTGIAKAFAGMPLQRIAGGHDHGGEPLAPLDVAALSAAIDAMDGRVEAYAVASTFAVRNAAHEQQARELIVARTGKPVTLSTELSSALDAPRRALTAVLNARLIARVTTLIDAVARAMQALGVSCPLMIVKGDGTLALAQSVATRPIETVLSGPAASLVGAHWLSGRENFILSDMGGTTTDLAVLQDGRPRVTEQGAEVGGWRTMVRAIDVRTIGLGGDSEIGLNARGHITVGPQRVVPLALLGARCPELLDMLRADLTDREGGSMHGRFVVLPFGASQPALSAELSARELEVLKRVGTRPTPLRQLGVSLGAQRAVASLKRKGLLQLAAFTPSDAAHVLGLQSNWSAAAARLGAQLAARFRDMKMPTPERTEAWAREVWNETVRLTARAVLDTAFGAEHPHSKLIDAVCSGEGMLGLARLSIAPVVPVVAVGGPVKVYYGEVARRLGCEMLFPEFHSVANAVGAATGVVAQQAVVRIDGDGSGLFTMHSPHGKRQFGDVAEALAAAHALARQVAHDAVCAMGASHPEVRLSVTKKLLPNARSDTGLLEAVVLAEAVGRPDGVSARASKPESSSL